MSHPQSGEPLLRVVRGHPDAAELAALTAVVVALAGAPTARESGRSTWAAPGRALRGVEFGRPGGWRSSALPR